MDMAARTSQISMQVYKIMVSLLRTLTKQPNPFYSMSFLFFCVCHTLSPTTVLSVSLLLHSSHVQNKLSICSFGELFCPEQLHSSTNHYIQGIIYTYKWDIGYSQGDFENGDSQERICLDKEYVKTTLESIINVLKIYHYKCNHLAVYLFIFIFYRRLWKHSKQYINTNYNRKYTTGQKGSSQNNFIQGDLTMDTKFAGKLPIKLVVVAQ